MGKRRRRNKDRNEKEWKKDIDDWGLDLKQMEVEGIIDKAYCMHENKIKNKLINEYVKKPLARIPLDEIRDYFGEEVAFYFSWLGKKQTKRKELIVCRVLY